MPKKTDSQSKDEMKEVKEITDKASKEKSDAAKSRSQAAELKRKAEQFRKQAEDLVGQASDFEDEAIQDATLAGKKKSEALDLKSEAERMKSDSKDQDDAAVAAEKKALDGTAAQRLCIHLPGVKLKGGTPKEFPPVIGEHPIKDEWQCSDWCLRHAECKQAVFEWDTKTCHLYDEALDEPLAFRDRWPWHNSSYCGTKEEKSSMLKMLHKVYNAKPWVLPPHNCSWGGDNCMDTKCCADVCKPNWEFTECKFFTCFKKDENYAGCNSGPPDASWDGTKLGGHPNGEVAPAPDGKLIQGTKLFCFTVVMWSAAPAEGWMDSEAMMANHWKEQKKGIMQCDDHALFDGLEGGSVHNIQSFIRAWNMVKDDGRWKRNDWSIKVDPDAVFFPDHLRTKIMYNYKTPQGSTVYLRNTFYKFQFLGALEVLTREALELYFEKGWECEAKLGQEGGEDYWLEQCLEGLGIDFQTDVGLLHDKYASDENCGDPNGVAHHFFKKIEGGDGYDNCWNTANEAWNNAHPDE